MNRQERLASYDPDKVIVVDIETTGLYPYNKERPDEILSIGIINLAGDVLFNGMFKPEKRVKWPKAEAVNGISPSMVADKPSVVECRAEIEAAFTNAKLLVGYNLDFDLSFLEVAGVKLPKCVHFDVMTEFAKAHCEWNPRFEEWKSCKLSECAAYYGVTVENAHSALADAALTANAFEGLLEDPWFDVPRVKPKLLPEEETYGNEVYDYGDDEMRIYYPVSVSKNAPEPELKQDAQPVSPAQTQTIVSESANNDGMKQPRTSQEPVTPKKGSKLLIPVGILCILVGALLAFGGALPGAVVLWIMAAISIAAGKQSIGK